MPEFRWDELNTRIYGVVLGLKWYGLPNECKHRVKTGVRLMTLPNEEQEHWDSTTFSPPILRSCSSLCFCTGSEAALIGLWWAQTKGRLLGPGQSQASAESYERKVRVCRCSGKEPPTFLFQLPQKKELFVSWNKLPYSGALCPFSGGKGFCWITVWVSPSSSVSILGAIWKLEQ